MNSRKLAIEYLPVTSLRPDPNNARLHSDKQVQQIARSIEAFGFNVPVLVDANSHVMAGHGRLKACRLLSITQVPVIRLEHLSEHQRRGFMLADNRLTENSEWDTHLLGEQLKILSEAELDFSLEVTGFEMGEIDLMIENLSPANDGGDDPVDALPEPSSVQVSRIGDLWQLGRHNVLCGDALSRDSYKSLMGDCRAHVVFTDPPYNVQIAEDAIGKGENQHSEFVMASGEMSGTDFEAFLSGVLKLAAEHSLVGSLHYICTDWRHIAELAAAGRAAYSGLKNLCVWVKDNAGTGSLYRSQHEVVFVFEHGKSSHRNNAQLGRFGRSRSNVCRYPGANSLSRSSSEGDLLALHPTVKQVAMVADAILDCSTRGDLVVDPFLGSGTTLMAAERTGRICRGLEFDPRYVDSIVRRWQAFTGEFAYRVTGGRRFNELEKEAACEQQDGR
jgi:DNA modification methylase